MKYFDFKIVEKIREKLDEFWKFKSPASDSQRAPQNP